MIASRKGFEWSHSGWRWLYLGGETASVGFMTLYAAECSNGRRIDLYNVHFWSWFPCKLNCIWSLIAIQQIILALLLLVVFAWSWWTLKVANILIVNAYKPRFDSHCPGRPNRSLFEKAHDGFRFAAASTWRWRIAKRSRSASLKWSTQCRHCTPLM